MYTINKQYRYFLTPDLYGQGGLKGAPGSSLELVAADIVQPATLLPEMFQGVTQAVLATAVKVSPKEGDNEARDKYNQVSLYANSVLGVECTFLCIAWGSNPALHVTVCRTRPGRAGEEDGGHSHVTAHGFP